MANAPDTFTPEQIREFIERAFKPWSDVETSAIQVIISKVINDPTKTKPQADQENVIFWEYLRTPRESNAEGKAYPYATECDIWLYPQAPFTLIDVHGIIMHELGHCLGLAHSVATGVMPKFTGLPILGVDDKIALSILHPHPTKLIEKTSATIKGQVMRKGQPLVGALLRVIDRRNGRVILNGFSGLVDNQTRKDASGYFELPGIPPGRYKLIVEPMDEFIAHDLIGYGAPVSTAPDPFKRLSIELPNLKEGDVYNVGRIKVEAP